MLPRRFWDKVRKTDGCWYWIGAISSEGYPRFRLDDRVENAYRFSWADLHGTIPADMQIDHRCHTDSTCTSGTSCLHRRCVRPDHLELVTQPENARRAHIGRLEFCRNGHQRTSENTRVRVRGSKPAARDCLTCARESQRTRRALA